MASTGVSSLNQILGSDGYADKSTVLVVGPAWHRQRGSWRFIQSGLAQGDFCLYVTRLSVQEVLHDEKAFGIDSSQRVPFWFASEGGQARYDIGDFASLLYNVKEVLKKNSDRRIRIVTDVISSLLMLPETIR